MPARSFAASPRTRPHSLGQGPRTAWAGPRGATVRLPWWALTLPTLSFLALLCLLAGSGPASAAGEIGGARELTEFLARMWRVLSA
ncbi:hypothetical protein [Streptomyces sp. NPDC006879]|uniref:hypothetical protein n=1 Tax=Streptomyces sp. NPDC006879 TaxID=3364767 RepID=UPI00369EFC49